MMVFNSTTKVFLTALTVSSTLALTSELGLSQPQPAPGTVVTTFGCVPLVGGGYATVAQRGERTTPPMITWKKTSGKFTPEKRCNIVGERLTKAVAANGGKLRQVRLTYGPVNGIPVICHINNLNEKCSSTNLLLTLNHSDRGKEDQLLQQLVTFSVTGSSPSLDRDAQGRVIINLGILVDIALETKASESPGPNTPVTQPQQPAPSTVPPVVPPTDNGI